VWVVVSQSDANSDDRVLKVLNVIDEHRHIMLTVRAVMNSKAKEYMNDVEELTAYT
jgi:hypothetical protein